MKVDLIFKWTTALETKLLSFLPMKIFTFKNICLFLTAAIFTITVKAQNLNMRKSYKGLTSSVD